METSDSGSEDVDGTGPLMFLYQGAFRTSEVEEFLDGPSPVVPPSGSRSVETPTPCCLVRRGPGDGWDEE